MNRKEDLQNELNAHKKGLNADIEEIKVKGKKVALSALVIGGVFFLSYTIARGISSGKQKTSDYQEPYQGAAYLEHPQKVKKSGIGSKLGGIIMSELAIIMVALAKKELKNFISRINIPDGEEDTE